MDCQHVVAYRLYMRTGTDEQKDRRTERKTERQKDRKNRTNKKDGAHEPCGPQHFGRGHLGARPHVSPLPAHKQSPRQRKPPGTLRRLRRCQPDKSSDVGREAGERVCAPPGASEQDTTHKRYGARNGYSIAGNITRLMLGGRRERQSLRSTWVERTRDRHKKGTVCINMP